MNVKKKAGLVSLTGLALLTAVLSCSTLVPSQQHSAVRGVQEAGSERKWKLIFSDEFNSSGSFDTTKWSFSKRWHPPGQNT